MAIFSTETSGSRQPAAINSLAEAWSILESRGWLAERSEATRKRLRSAASLRTYRQGEYVYRSGDKSDSIYGLVAGGLEISIPRVDEEEFVIHRADTGWWAGELGVFSGQRRLISMRATVPSQLVLLKKARLIPLIDSHPELMYDFYELSHREMAVALQLLGNLVMVGAESRVALRLLMMHDALPPGSDYVQLSQATLAAVTAISQPTLRRVLRTLEERQLVETGYNKIRVLDHAGLRASLKH